MAQRRAKSIAELEKCIMEKEQHLAELEEALEKKKQEKYADIGKWFVAAYEYFPEFDFLHMTKRQMHRFVQETARYYKRGEEEKRMEQEKLELERREQEGLYECALFFRARDADGETA